MLLIKGNTKINIKIKNSKIPGYNYTYVIREHKRRYNCQTTPEFIRVLGKLEGRGFRTL